MPKPADCTGEVSIRGFQPGDEAAFRALNVEWIQQFFRLEKKDEQAFANPQATVLDQGGQILMAVCDGESVGCCALLPMGSGSLEIAKMAVSPRHQGQGIGRKLLSAAIGQARALGAKRLYLESNRILTAAVRLYESIGFRHLQPEEIVPSPYARADVYMEMLLT